MSFFKPRTRERSSINIPQLTHSTREQLCLCNGPNGPIVPSQLPEANILRINQKALDNRGRLVSSDQINLCNDRNGYYCHHQEGLTRMRGKVCPQPNTLPAGEYQLEVVQMRRQTLQTMVKNAEKRKNA